MADDELLLLRRLRRLLYRQLLHLRLGRTEKAEGLFVSIRTLLARLPPNLDTTEETRALLRSLDEINDEITLRFEVEKRHIMEQLFIIEVEQKLQAFLRKN